MVESERVLYMGDSWASAVEADTGVKYGGWPKFAGVHRPHNCAVPGSTAEDWYVNKDNWMRTAIDKCLSGDIDVAFISLGGNDIRKADDGTFKEYEFLKATSHMLCCLGSIVHMIHRTGVHTVTGMYANPFPNNPQAKEIVDMINIGIKNVSRMCFSFEDALRGTEGAFDGKDIHPTREGHLAIARSWMHVLDLLPGRGEAPDTVGGVAVV